MVMKQWLRSSDVGPVEQPLEAFAEQQRGPTGAGDRGQGLVRAPAGQVVAPVETGEQVDPRVRNGDVGDGLEPVDVGHVDDDEPGLVAMTQQRSQDRRRCEVGMDDHERPRRAGGGCFLQLAGRDAGELGHAELDQPIDLGLERREVGEQCHEEPFSSSGVGSCLCRLAMMPPRPARLPAPKRERQVRRSIAREAHGDICTTPHDPPPSPTRRPC